MTRPVKTSEAESQARTLATVFQGGSPWEISPRPPAEATGAKKREAATGRVSD